MKDRTQELIEFCDEQACYLERIRVLSDALVNLLIERQGTPEQIQSTAIFLHDMVDEAQAERSRFTQRCIEGAAE